MIRAGELSEPEQLSSQMILRNYLGMNALAMACSGETMLILLAIRLGIPDSLIAGIGAFGYLSFLVLPFGFRSAGRHGVGESIRKQGLRIALVCGALAFSGFLPAGSGLAGVLFFGCLVGLYFFRACASSMIFPLQKGISTEKTLPVMLARNSIVCGFLGLAATLLLALLLATAKGTYTLPLIFAGGAGFAWMATAAISRIDEPEKLKRFAARPIVPQVKLAWSDPLLRRQLVVGCLLNLSLAMMLPVNVLAVRRGCGFDNAETLILSSVQVLTAIAASWLTKHLPLRYGPRNLLVATYPLIWLLSLYWILVPESPPLLLAAVPFVVAGFMQISYSMGLANYFLVSVSDRLQIGGTFLVYVVTGGCMGALGIALNALIFHFVPAGPGSLTPFRMFYLACGALFSVWIFVPASLPVKFREFRLKNRK